MEEKGISIIVPFYNTGILLKECVDSILAQPFKVNYEIILVNDGSTDDETIKIAHKLSLHNKVRIITVSENKGVQNARTIGLFNAIFKYVLLVDADDLLNTTPSILINGTYPDLAIKAMEESEDIAFVHCIHQMFEQASGITFSAYPLDEERILSKHHVSTWIIYRRLEGIKSGGYNEKIKKWQDWSFAVSLLNSRLKEGKTNNIHFIDTPFYLYRMHTRSPRISSSHIIEKDMIRTTYELYPEIFQNYYQGMNTNEIIEQVFTNKPNKLKDLLYMASYNLPQALDLAESRKFKLSSELDKPNTP